MAPATTLTRTVGAALRAAVAWIASWWRIVHLGAQLLALTLTPSTWRGATVHAFARHVAVGTAPSLLWFTVLSALISVVVIRIVLVTAVSYGLTQYALEMVVRVLVLELIPLTAALFAALRCTLPLAAEVAALRARGDAALDGEDGLRREVLPRVLAGAFSAWLLAAVSGALTLVIAYLSVYGLTTSGFAAYTHTVGHVFDPAVSLIFVLKVMLLGAAVALIPVATALDQKPRRHAGTSAELQGLVRMFLLILLIEALALLGNYY
jgi:phospholipid/cholesterol/gamma-HCH transport system permease protein